MQRVVSSVVALAWGLWCGGIVMVFVTVMSLFKTFPEQPKVAGAAAAGVFRRFEVMELVLAPVALVAALLWRDKRRSLPRVWVVMFLSVAAAGAATSRFMITPKIDDMRRRGVPSSSEEFRSAHRAATSVYVAQAAVLLAAGILLPAAIVGPRRKDESSPS